MPPKAFWWQWPWRCALRPFWSRKGRAVAPAAMSGGEHLLDEERRRGERRDLGLRQEVQELVAEGVEAGRLEPDDAAAAPRRAATGRRACAAPLRAPRRRGPPRGRCGRSTSGRPFGAGAVKAVARRGEDALGGGEVLGLEVAVEGVAEEDEVAAVARHRLGGGGPAGLAPRPSSMSASSGGRRSAAPPPWRGRRPGCGRGD